MRPTPTLIVDDELILRPAARDHIEGLVEAFEESMPQVIDGLPWYELETPMLVQLEEYLFDVERGGRIGRAHHWSIFETETNRFLGLVAYDRYTRTKKANWNLGYWVRDSATRRGIAKQVSNRVLQWIPTADGRPTAVEITVNPENRAGLATCESLVKNWFGERATEADGEVKVAGEMRHHITYVIPRLPLKGEASIPKGEIWLSLDTDDEPHHPKVSGHRTRSSSERVEPYVMTPRLAEAWKGYFAWRKGSGKTLPVTLFVVAEQLDDNQFSSFLRQALEDKTVTIGCHGNKHRCWSSFGQDESGFSHELSVATSRLSRFAGSQFRFWFRAPGGYISDWMIEVLSKQGYSLDSSISRTKISSKKVSGENGFRSIIYMTKRFGLVERPWYSWIGIPMTGPALRLPFLRRIANRRWRLITKKSRSANESQMESHDEQIISLYWHLLDYSLKDGRWQPPIHPTFAEK